MSEELITDRVHAIWNPPGVDPDPGPAYKSWADVPPTLAEQRRARAQAQPRGDGGRFVVNHEKPGQLYAVWEEVRAQDATIASLTATLAERDAELKSACEMISALDEKLAEQESELIMARAMVVTRQERILDLEAEAELLDTQVVCFDIVSKHRDRLLIELSAADRSLSEMAGTIRDQKAEIACLRARIARPELIPMPGMKLGIFIGSFVTMLGMAAVHFVWGLV